MTLVTMFKSDGVHKLILVESLLVQGIWQMETSTCGEINYSGLPEVAESRFADTNLRLLHIQRVTSLISALETTRPGLRSDG